MPPVPSNTFIAESATAIVRRNAPSTSNELQPINLSMNNQGDAQPKVQKVNVTGDNNAHEEPNWEVNMETSTEFFDPYVNCAPKWCLGSYKFSG